MRRIITLFFCLVFYGCSPDSLEDYQKEAQYLLRSIAEDLEEVKTKEDLNRIYPKLVRKFDKLATLLMEVDSSQKGLREKGIMDFTGSQKLLFQMKRIYQIHGAREVMEKAQIRALKRLAQYHKEASY